MNAPPPDARPPASASASGPGDLAPLRARIDELDARIVQLLNERAQVVVEVGRIKSHTDAPIFAPDREHAVLTRLDQLNQGPLPAASLRAIYRELMSASFLLEKPLRIAYLGPEGSFSHAAAAGKFGSSVQYVPMADIPAVFAEVGRRHVDFGVVPIENTSHGGVIDTLDAFLASRIQICSEVLLDVHHNLLANGPMEQIQRVYSKPEVFSQCARWLATVGLLDKCIASPSTSAAARLARDEPHAAALASKLAAEIYSLPILCPRVEDQANNTTRFFVIGRQPAKPSGDDKTAIMFTTAHKAGALVRVLNAFERAGINLTMITSRPSRRRNWEYYFFVDAEGHAELPPMKDAIDAVRPDCLELHILGSFPRVREVIE